MAPGEGRLKGQLGGNHAVHALDHGPVAGGEKALQLTRRERAGAELDAVAVEDGALQVMEVRSTDLVRLQIPKDRPTRDNSESEASKHRPSGQRAVRCLEVSTVELADGVDPRKPERGRSGRRFFLDEGLGSAGEILRGQALHDRRSPRCVDEVKGGDRSSGGEGEVGRIARRWCQPWPIDCRHRGKGHDAADHGGDEEDGELREDAGDRHEQS